MARFAEAILRGEVEDSLSPTGERRPLFLNGQIPNHGVLGRRGAAGYLQRVARELSERGLDGSAASRAADFMNRSSDMFQSLRYQTDLMKGGELLTLIAQAELGALAEMRKAWEQVKQLPSN
jgi:hypothetical protein